VCLGQFSVLVLVSPSYGVERAENTGPNVVFTVVDDAIFLEVLYCQSASSEISHDAYFGKMHNDKVEQQK
jgi:hypothetical protein